MKLNPDCIRDILSEVENTCDLSNDLDMEEDSIPDSLMKYSYQEIKYHVMQCKLNGFFTICTIDYSDSVNIGYLTPSGHEFIANIREQTVWNGVKSIATKVGSTSLGSIVQIASSVITEIIKSQFSLV